MVAGWDEDCIYTYIGKLRQLLTDGLLGKRNPLGGAREAFGFR